MKMKDLVISMFGTGKIPRHAANSTTRFWVYANLHGNNIMIQPRKFLRVPIGFKTKMPRSWIGMAFLNPHLIFEKNLEIASPLIETSEGDEWAIYVYNNSDSTQILEHDEKLAQIIFFKARECKMLPHLEPSFGADDPVYCRSFFKDKGEKDFGIAGNSDEA